MPKTNDSTQSVHVCSSEKPLPLKISIAFHTLLLSKADEANLLINPVHLTTGNNSTKVQMPIKKFEKDTRMETSTIFYGA